MAYNEVCATENCSGCKNIRTMEDIKNELDTIVDYIEVVPDYPKSPAEQMDELKQCGDHIKMLFQELIDYSDYLTVRLRHSETERFKGYL